MKKLIYLSLVIVLLLAVSVCSAETTKQTTQAQPNGDKSLYDKAYTLYESKKYYDAYELFNQSQYGDWEKMANKCVRRWPKNGQIWRDNTQWLQDTRLTFKVEQPKDTAIFIRVYKDNEPLSYVFIGGSDEISLMVPGNGTYTIKDGVGSKWFGETDTFGAIGAYETMTFTPREEETIYLTARMAYTITINIDDVIGEDVGTHEEDWKNFTK